VRRPARRAIPWLIVLAAVASTGTVVSAGNTVPASSLGQSAQVVSANTLKPSACASLTLSTVVAGGGTFSGTAAANLMTGSAAVDTMSAVGGNDCLLGGGGNDSLNGGNGTDVCIGGLGTDTFAASCETQIQ
jgi:Ca2+-binding RTX toxin-like protein